MKTDFVSQVYIIRTKIHDQNKNAIGAKARSLWEWIFVLFSAAQKVCSKLENQAKCDSAVFVTNPLKIHFSHTFWLLEMDIIARTNYDCKIGHRAQPVKRNKERKEKNMTRCFENISVTWKSWAKDPKFQVFVILLHFSFSVIWLHVNFIKTA